MELALFLIIFSLVYSVDQGKKEWRHQRDGYAQVIKRDNPGWHPRKVRRHARRRAFTWWSLEAVKGFPSMRRAWAEDRDHVRYLRETDRISRETRIEELRAELDAIRKGREEHDAAKRAGRTRVPFGTWYQENAPRIRRGEPATEVPDPKERSSAAPPPIEETRPSPGGAAPSPVSTPSAERAETANERTASDFDAAIREGRPEEVLGALDMAFRAGWAARPERKEQPVFLGSREQADAYYAQFDKAKADANADKATESDGDPAPQAPGQPTGTPNHDNDNEGDPMTANVPNGELAGDSPYRAAFDALEQYNQVAEQHRQAGEVLEAQLTMHGFDRDPALMEKIRGMQESATQISLHTSGARETLIANHGQGEEYHRSGVDADSSAFRND